MDFGILAQWLTLLRMGLLGVAACKYTTKFFIQIFAKKIYTFSTSALKSST